MKKHATAGITRSDRAMRGRYRSQAIAMVISEMVTPTMSAIKKAARVAIPPRKNPISGIHLSRTMMGVKTR